MADQPSWLAALDDADQARFFAEMQAALDAAKTEGTARSLEICLREWRVTGQALSDRQRRAVLTGDGCFDSDYMEVPRP